TTAYSLPLRIVVSYICIRDSLSTKGVSGGNSSAIVMLRYFSSIICWITLGGAYMIAGACTDVLGGVDKGASLLKITGWIGIAVNLIVPAFIVLFLVLPKLMQKLTVGVVKIGYKLKIVKDIEKTTVRATKVVSDFKNSFKLMAKSPVKLILLILVCFTESAITFAMPYFVMKAFNCPVDSMAFTIMSLNVYATFGVSFIPTPGNSGVVEGLGALAFSQAAGNTLAWSVLAWRLVVFYVYIIIGLFITVYDIIAKNIRYKRGLKK
ncbi:MAG: flippase-like domain-containing protein, partial [Clostridia bacterium]|nr:flippase-like domain-containing protein [Clostridia bacterium]